MRTNQDLLRNALNYSLNYHPDEFGEISPVIDWNLTNFTPSERDIILCEIEDFFGNNELYLENDKEIKNTYFKLDALTNNQLASDSNLDEIVFQNEAIMIANLKLALYHESIETPYVVLWITKSVDSMEKKTIWSLTEIITRAKEEDESKFLENEVLWTGLITALNNALLQNSYTKKIENN